MSKREIKNIILCADGTGNKGGYTPDSNVFKLYNAIDLHANIKQITYYDNGVGTQESSFVSGFSGALGFGFEKNVKQMYEFLARNYHPGDNIYMFGFSRGAATVRAFNGMLNTCGLLKGEGLGNKHLEGQVKTAMRYYKKQSASREAALDAIGERHKNVPVKFIGVWDTVSALGFPVHDKYVGIGLGIAHQLFRGIDWLSDFIVPHNFYDYNLNDNVEKARHALAIDDERTIFLPVMWDEKNINKDKTDVEQVWFAGMHSNVGGGYERGELANVCFDWMLRQMKDVDVVFDGGLRDSAYDSADVHGHMYDSRAGAASYYSYNPRHIQTLCDAAGVTPRVHHTVLDRMSRRTENYAPRFLPKKFEVVEMNEDGSTKVTPSPEVHDADWETFRSRIYKPMFMRKLMYSLMIEGTIVGIIFMILWQFPHQYMVNCSGDVVTTLKNSLDGSNASPLIKNFIYFLQWFTPDVADGFLYEVFVENILKGIGLIVVVPLYIVLRMIARERTLIWAERIRKLYLLKGDGHPRFSGSAKTDTSED